MSTISVRIDESLVDAARAAAKAEFRTVQGQVEFWAKVGRAALDNPELPLHGAKFRFSRCTGSIDQGLVDANRDGGHGIPFSNYHNCRQPRIPAWL